MTETTRRRRLIPRTAVVAAIIIVLLIGSAVAAGVLVAQSRLVEAPDVAGLPAEVAEESIVAIGLVYDLAGTRVSVTIPAGQVISQDPSAGTLLDPGSAVSVVVSAGPQTFVVPDLVGSTMQGATDALTALGLRVVTQEASSEATPGVVLEMFPAPGASVSAGDEIRLMVPGGSGAEQETLLPYDLRGATILIDPLPAPGSATGDVPMEIARRLRSLLEAAGATVTVTRTGASEAGTPAIRTAAAESSAADLFVGIDLGASGVPGLRVYHLPPEAEEPYAADSLKHARAITRAANLPGLIVNEPLPTSDPVLGAFGRTGVRVVVGDGTVDSDRSRFTDPAWADQIARAIYRGLGTTLAAP